MRLVSCVTLALLLVSLSQAIGLEPSRRQQYVVTVVLEETRPRGSKHQASILADPQIAVLANEEASFSKAGERKLGATKVPFGTLLNVHVAQLNGEKVRVTGMLEVSSVGKADAEIVQRESFSIHFDKIVELGSENRVCVSKTSDWERWFELLVDKPKGTTQK